MADAPDTRSELILYRTEDGRTRLQCRFGGNTLWLTQAQMAELFQTTPQNITLHLRAIFEEGELFEEATCKEYLQVRKAGQREGAGGHAAAPRGRGVREGCQAAQTRRSPARTETSEEVTTPCTINRKSLSCIIGLPRGEPR